MFLFDFKISVLWRKELFPHTSSMLPWQWKEGETVFLLKPNKRKTKYSVTVTHETPRIGQVWLFLSTRRWNCITIFITSVALKCINGNQYAQNCIFSKSCYHITNGCHIFIQLWSATVSVNRCHSRFCLVWQFQQFIIVFHLWHFHTKLAHLKLNMIIIIIPKL